VDDDDNKNDDDDDDKNDDDDDDQNVDELPLFAINFTLG